MSVTDLVLFVLIAAGAFYAGYQVGRLKALAELGGARRQPDSSGPLPGPLDAPYPSSVPETPRPRSSPPPSSAGNNGTWADAGGAGSGRAPPRRSTKPPPAAAGLMGTGETKKPAGRQK